MDITGIPRALRSLRALRAMVLCMLLPAAAICANGMEESPPSANLDYQAGIEAIKASDWKAAIQNLNVALVADPTNADLENWLGYAYRHEEKYDEALDHYRAAVQLNPSHRGAHEYMGETYLMMGDKAKAREQLALLLKICGKQCPEYMELDKAIAAAK